MTRKQVIQIALGIALFILAVTFGLFYNQHNRRETNDIFKNAKFSIGKVTMYNPRDYGSSRTMGNPSNVVVEFLAKDSLVTGKQFGDQFFTPSDSLNVNINYLVVYDSIDPSRFRIIFDSPIRDSTDLIKYITDSTRILRDIEHYSENLDKRTNKIIGSR